MAPFMSCVGEYQLRGVAHQRVLDDLVELGPRLLEAPTFLSSSTSSSCLQSQNSKATPAAMGRLGAALVLGGVLVAASGAGARPVPVTPGVGAAEAPPRHLPVSSGPAGPRGGGGGRDEQLTNRCVLYHLHRWCCGTGWGTAAATSTWGSGR